MSTQVSMWTPDDIDESVGGIKDITYADLLAKYYGNELHPGLRYRITDYQCLLTNVTINVVSNSTYTYAESDNYDSNDANRPFDIIVTAISTNKLDENAKIVEHDKSTFFNEGNIGYLYSYNFKNFDIKYSLTGENTYSWSVNTGSSKFRGVIYYMKDNFGNEAPYDFINIRFRRHKINVCDGWTVSIVENGASNPGILESKSFTAHNAYKGFYYGIPYTVSGGYGFDDGYVNIGTFRIDMTKDGKYYRTFGTNCRSNIIKPCWSGLAIKLNNIVLGHGCLNNTFGGNCSDITIGINCSYNNFIKNIQNTIFGMSCTGNSLDENSGRIQLGNYCTINTINKNTWNVIIASNSKLNNINCSALKMIGVDTGHGFKFNGGAIEGEIYSYNFGLFEQNIFNPSSSINLYHHINYKNHIFVKVIPVYNNDNVIKYYIDKNNRKYSKDNGAEKYHYEIGDGSKIETSELYVKTDRFEMIKKTNSYNSIEVSEQTPNEIYVDSNGHTYTKVENKEYYKSSNDNDKDEYYFNNISYLEYSYSIEKNLYNQPNYAYYLPREEFNTKTNMEKSIFVYSQVSAKHINLSDNEKSLTTYEPGMGVSLKNITTTGYDITAFSAPQYNDESIKNTFI